MFKKTTLENGLRIITVPEKNAKTVTVLVLVDAGSKDESKDISGISHFLEHMFFKGTKKRGSTIKIAETLDRLGGIYNAFTSEEYTGYFAKVAHPYFETALDWVADIFLNSKILEKEVAKEKGVIIEEINMISDAPMHYIDVLWHKLLYGDQPAGWHIAGTKQSIANLSQKKLKDYYNQHYLSSNTIICIAGNVSSALAEKKVEQYFSNIICGNPQKRRPIIEKQISPNLLLNYRKTDQTHFYLGVRGYDIFSAKRYAQDILAVILGGMMSSRLFIKVRERLGLAYYLRTSAVANTDAGYLVTQAGVDNKNVAAAIKAILQEYKSLAVKKVANAELKKAKDYIKGKSSLMLELSDSQASFFGTQELLQKEVLTPEEIYAKINKVDSNDILRLSQEIFQPKNLNLALIGPAKDKKKLQGLLKI